MNDLQVVCHLVRANWLVHVNHLVRSILSFAAGQNSQLRGAGPTTCFQVIVIKLDPLTDPRWGKLLTYSLGEIACFRLLARWAKIGIRLSLS